VWVEEGAKLARHFVAVEVENVAGDFSFILLRSVNDKQLVIGIINATTMANGVRLGWKLVEIREKLT
jgi:hypothetical protein